jgi:Predicted transcriptional regulators
MTSSEREQMQKKITEYRAADIAKLFDIHPNTIRLYEKSGFITPAKRNLKNNYRIFTEMHVYQVKLCRCIFGYPFTNRQIRNTGNEVMYASARMKWHLLRRKTNEYIHAIEAEIAMAQDTAGMLRDWAASGKERAFVAADLKLSRKEVAGYFGVTAEAVRNWERNALIVPETKGSKGEVRYSSGDWGRISVIYMLLQSGYSMAAIQRSIAMYDRGNAGQVLSALNEPVYDEIVSVGDNWLNELNKLLSAAQKIYPIIDELEKQ